MIPGIEEKRLVNGVIQNGWPSYATLHQASVSLQDMGDRVITTQVRIDGDVVPDFSGWELYFKGERFVLPSDNPQASKDNSTRNSIVDLQFQSWVIQELKRYYFFEAASVSAGVAIADKYVTPVRLDVEDFVAMLNQVLKYYFGDKVVADLYMSGQGQYSQEPKVIDINYSYLWDVVGQVYEIYGVRNRIVYNSTTGVYTIKFGWPTTDIDITDHDFEYGYQGGLLKFERQVQDETITNILLGRGGEKNLPYRYFKKVDPENPNWSADPDAIPELASIYFDRLRDINFRWYVRGWMHNPNRDTSGDEAWDPGHVFPTYEISSDSPYYWAYQKGLTDTQFNPVEFVKDDASIEAYGERWGAADDNDEIYPTIQGRSRSPIGRIDEVVAVSEIVTDDINATAAESALEKSINPLLVNYPRSNDTLPIDSATFEVPTGQTGNISYAWVGPTDGTGVHINTAQSTLVAVDTLGTEHSISGLSAGAYFLRLRLTLYVPSGQQAYGTFGMENIKLTTSAQDANAWKPTFDIWVKNIWGTTKGSSESADQYATRVWQDILGDRAGNEAKVVFSTGFMSVSEDYEFVIASYPVYDTSKTINGVPSEWRITLRKSDAEYDATGLFIPNASTGGKPIAGDKFFFTGIDMPFLYVTLGEEDLNTNKSSQLEGLSVVNPTWVISLDKVRVHTLEDGEYGRTLADRLAAGAKLRITDPRFSGGDILTLYAQSITYTWNEPSENSPYIVPDIEVVLSDKVVSRQSRADKMESSIQEIRSNYARLDDVERVVRSVAEPMFLKKTGEADSSDSPTQFASKVSSKGFRQGGVGGNGWGFYRDNTKEVAEGEEGDGDSVLEVDRVVVRKELQVNSLVVNQTEYRGGREIQSAAKIECTKVVVDDSGKYVCYFDQKQGSVKNLFVVGDFAYSTEFAPDNTVVKYYRRRVDAVDVDRIVLSDTVKDGAGVPAAGDVIIQYGHEQNTARQYVIVRDVIGGGYERMISGLSTVSSNGSEYYFAGRQSGQYSNLPRWFVGAAAGEYAEYLNGQLNIKGRLQVLGESGNYSDLGYLADALPKKGATLIQGGLVLTSMIQLGQVESSAFKVYSGINGKVDETLADPTKTIAAWYGGEMLEKTAWDAMSAEDKLAHQYAKTIYRFDGSGYLAGGNIHWDENGYGGIPGITWSRPAGSQNDVITIGSNVILEAGQGADQSVAALVSSVNSLQQILDWFEEVNLGDAQNPAWAVRLKKKTVGSSQLNRAFVTYGDQIVGSGTPGGGGSAGKSYLHELLDVYGNPGDVQRADGTARQSGDLLGYNSTLDKWVAIAQSAITPDLSDYYTKSQTDSAIATAITALGLGAAATYDVASSVTQNDSTHLVTGAAVYSAINTAISSAIKFQGITTTALTDGSTTNPITIDGQSFTAQRGDEVIYGGKEFLWTGSKWQQLGDEESWANKTITISAGTGLTGGGNLESNRTISLSQDSIDKLGLAASALQSSNIKTLTIQLDGTTVGSAYNPIGSANHTVNIAKSSLSSLLSDTFHPYGGSTTLATFKIGGATITWHAASGNTPGYLEIDSALTTQGDQIVVSGTPGGGGGGAGWLYELGDVYGTTAVLRADGTEKQVGDVLQYYDSTKGWVAVPSTSIGITTDATQSVHGLMSAADKTKLDGINLANYVAKAGDTMTGTLEFGGGIEHPIKYYTANCSGSWAREALGIFNYAGTQNIGFGGYGESGSSISYAYIGTDYASSYAIRVYPSQNPTVGTNTIYHAGNANNTSSSWTCDYLYCGGYNVVSAIYIGRAYDGERYYFIGSKGTSGQDSYTFEIKNVSAGVESSIALVSGFVGITGNVGVGLSSASYAVDVNGSVRASSQFISSVSTGTAPLSVASSTLVSNLNADLLDGYNASCGSNTPYGTIPVIHPNGRMDVGKHFEFHYDNTTGSDYSTALGCTGNYGNYVNLPSASGTLALTTDNVASATQLQTSRSLWGNSFNGTADINDTITLADYRGIQARDGFINVRYIPTQSSFYAGMKYDAGGTEGLIFSTGYSNASIVFCPGVNLTTATKDSTYVFKLFTNEIIENAPVTQYREINAYADGGSAYGLRYIPSSTWGSWVRSALQVYTTNDTVNVGAYGDVGTQIKYGFFGWGYDNSYAIRVYGAQNPTVGQNTIYHAGNANNSSASWTCDTLYCGGYNVTRAIYIARAYSGEYYFWIGSNPNRTYEMRISSGGSGGTDTTIDLLNGTVTIGDNIVANGSLTTGGDQVISSDLTKKTNFQNINLSVEQIAKAPAVTFDWKAGGHSFGSIAQYWKPLLGEMVLGEEGNYTLAYAQGAFVNAIINARAIVALQGHETEQDKEIRELREALGRANEKIEGLEKEVKQLRMN